MGGKCSMTQAERLEFLIQFLLKENPEYSGIKVPEDGHGQKRLLRSLMNVRPPRDTAEHFLKVQDEYLTEEVRKKGVVSLEDLMPVEPGIYLWQGDITTIQADAIVNAANSALLGCFVPGHGCIDNAIHSAAGIQLRLECQRIMEMQRREEAVGTAKITGAYNLPCRFILHTVGPYIDGELTQEDCGLLASCYRACLSLAEEHGLGSIVFCCISTGEFHFPNDKAAQIAVDTVRTWRNGHQSGMEVVFNVFKDTDMGIYRQLLGAGQTSV